MEIDQNDFKQLLTLLQKLVEKSEPSKDTEDVIENEEESIDEPAKIKRRSAIGGVPKAKPKKKKSTNKFLSMKENSMHKGDIEIDKKLNRFPPTERSRKFEYVQIKCRVCGKEEKVIPALAEARDRYKCNRCSTSPG